MWGGRFGRRARYQRHFASPQIPMCSVCTAEISFKFGDPEVHPPRGEPSGWGGSSVFGGEMLKIWPQNWPTRHSHKCQFFFLSEGRGSHPQGGPETWGDPCGRGTKRQVESKKEKHYFFFGKELIQNSTTPKKLFMKARFYFSHILTKIALNAIIGQMKKGITCFKLPMKNWDETCFQKF